MQVPNKVNLYLTLIAAPTPSLPIPPLPSQLQRLNFLSPAADNILAFISPSCSVMTSWSCLPPRAHGSQTMYPAFLDTATFAIRELNETMKIPKQLEVQQYLRLLVTPTPSRLQLLASKFRERLRRTLVFKIRLRVVWPGLGGSGTDGSWGRE